MEKRMGLSIDKCSFRQLLSRRKSFTLRFSSNPECRQPDLHDRFY